MNTTANPSFPSPGAVPRGRPLVTRKGWLIIVGLALAGIGLAAGLAWQPAPPDEFASPSSIAATKASLAPNETVLDASGKPDSDLASDRAKQGTPVPLVANKPAAHVPAPTPTQTAAAVPQPVPPVVRSPQYANSSGTAAPVCARCGTVESVREVTIKGKGTGLGAVAGGVLGGAVGNQMGHGNGRAAMTVLGAIGGGYAGNEVEKRARSEKAYEVHVRMDDGTVRTFQQKVAPAKGTRVTVDGKAMHVTRKPATGTTASAGR